MDNERNLAKAKEVFDQLVATLDSKNWHYDKVEEKLMIQSGVKGDDLPIEFSLFVRPRNQVVQLLSRLPFEVPEDKRIDMAIATCVANFKLVDGSFDYDISDGTILFRQTCSFRESILGAELFEYMIYCAAGTIDEYNDQFFMLAKNMITIQQFMEKQAE